ncbi:MAG: DHA2 family efflux MFS transporter permease subunit [Candidatus Entotheonellia bacterium]
MAYPDTTPKPKTGSQMGGLIDPVKPSHRWWVAATVMLSGFLVPMSQTAMQVALPQIMTVFGLDLDQAQWIVTAYVIAGAMLVPAVGWLGNWLGNRTFYVLCLSLFVVNSALCALSWSGSSLIAFRILQGLGGGPIPPMTMLFLSNVFPPAQRGMAMGLFGMGQTSGPIVGTVIGGYLTEYLSWRMVCFLNVAPGVVCIALVLLVLPNVREEVRHALDLAGLLTMGVFLVSLLVALSRGQREGWDAPFIQRLFVVAGVAFVTFIACELLAKEPLVDLRLYTNVTFAAVSGVMLLFFMNFTASTFLLVILMQRLLEYTPAQAGLALLPGSLVLALSFPLAGRVADQCDRRVTMLCGLSVFALSSYLFTFLSLEWPLSWIVWLVVLRFSCGGFVYAPMTAAALSQLSPEKVRMGAGLLNLMQNGLGNTLGLAMVTTVLQRRLTYHSSVLDQQQVFSALNWGEMLAPVRAFVRQAGAIGPLAEAQVLTLVQGHLEQQATVASYQDCFMLVTLLCLVSMPLVLLLRKP